MYVTWLYPWRLPLLLSNENENVWCMWMCVFFDVFGTMHLVMNWLINVVWQYDKQNGCIKTTNASACWYISVSFLLIVLDNILDANNKTNDFCWCLCCWERFPFFHNASFPPLHYSWFLFITTRYLRRQCCHCWISRYPLSRNDLSVSAVVLVVVWRIGRNFCNRT